MAFAVYPSKSESESKMTTTYNSVVGTHRLLQSANSVIILDNDAIRAMSIRSTLTSSFTDMNMITAHLVSGITSSIRYNGCLNENLAAFEKNLVSLPRFKFISSSHGPYLPIT
jgi:tubulin alpha